MISGKISVYKEPKKHKQYDNYPPHWYMGEDYGMGGSTVLPKEDELAALIQLSQSLGYTTGTRVKRASGIGTEGVIAQVYNTVSMAWSYTKQEWEPLLVRWDPQTPACGHSAFTYHPDDLTIIRPHVPALLTVVKE